MSPGVLLCYFLWKKVTKELSQSQRTARPPAGAVSCDSDREAITNRCMTVGRNRKAGVGSPALTACDCEGTCFHEHPCITRHNLRHAEPFGSLRVNCAEGCHAFIPSLPEIVLAPANMTATPVPLKILRNKEICIPDCSISNTRCTESYMQQVKSFESSLEKGWHAS